MAWGVKTMKFKSGSKVKIGNVVLEALQSQIIRDYISATEDHNKSCCPEGLIRIFSSSTYRRWLKVTVFWSNQISYYFYVSIRQWNGRKARLLLGWTAMQQQGKFFYFYGHLHSYIFRFDALDTLGNIISELKANDKTKTELKDKLTVTFQTTLK